MAMTAELVTRGPEREARRVVRRQLGFVGHLIVYALGCLLLAVTAGLFPALVVAIAWGIALASHGFFAVAAPILRGPLERHAIERLAPTPLLAPPAGRPLEELSAAIAHEIRTPITAAKSLVQQIAEDPSAPEALEYAAVAVAELDRVERSIAHLLRFARAEAVELADMRMVDVVQAAVEGLRERAAKLGARLTTSIEDAGPMRGDAEKLRRVIENLLANALDAVEGAKRDAPRIEIASGQNLAGTEIWVSVRDDGPGFDETARERLFSPFYTSKAGGTGFGLALTKKTIEAHGGTIEAKARAGGGAEVVFSLPRGRGDAT